MKIVLKPLVRSVLIPLRLSGTVSVTDLAVHRIYLGSGLTTLITSSEEINDTMKKVKSSLDAGLLMSGGSETIKYKAKEENCEFYSI